MQHPLVTASIFLRVEDGPLQLAAVRPSVRNLDVDFYNVLNSAVRPFTASANTKGACASLADIRGDILVFINKPLESLNHLFLEELVKAARQEDCGLVTGISASFSGDIISSGCIRDASGECIDAFAGHRLSDCLRLPEFTQLRDVSNFSGDFFAVRREHLQAVGGLALVSSSRMHRVIERLVTYAMSERLRLVVNPKAVATIEQRPHCLVEAELQQEHRVKQSNSAPSRTNPRYPAWRYVIPIPPDDMMWHVGAATIENFLIVADAWAQLISRYTSLGARVLDIGCGCGRLARALITNRHVARYIGFDIMRGHLEWCREFIEPAWAGVAEFHWYDIYSARYNPKGPLQAQALRFPCADREIDVAFAASVFTHLLEPDARHYLAETARVLAPTGLALLSIHDQPLPNTLISGAEDRIDISPDYFLEMAHHAGLQQLECIEEFCGQRLFIFQRT